MAVIVVKVDDELHDSLKVAAKALGKSMAQFIRDAVNESIGKPAA